MLEPGAGVVAAMAALENAEAVARALPREALESPRMEELRRPLWWAQTRLAMLRMEAGDAAGALEPGPSGEGSADDERADETDDEEVVCLGRCDTSFGLRVRGSGFAEATLAVADAVGAESTASSSVDPAAAVTIDGGSRNTTRTTMPTTKRPSTPTSTRRELVR